MKSDFHNNNNNGDEIYKFREMCYQIDIDVGENRE